MKNLDLSSFDTSNGTFFDGMFYHCGSLKNLDISSFDTGKALDFGAMFAGCKSMKYLDLYHMSAKNVKNMDWMFKDCTSLRAVDLRGFDLEWISTDDMFAGCSMLMEIKLPVEGRIFAELPSDSKGAAWRGAAGTEIYRTNYLFNQTLTRKFNVVGLFKDIYNKQWYTEYVQYVYDNGLTDKEEIKIDTLSGVKTINVNVEEGKVVSARVDMGKPIFRCKDIPMISDHFIFVDQGLVLSDNYGEEKVVYNGTSISMGNPHFVTFVKDVDSLNLEELGPQFEHHPLFPEGVNTEFVEVIDKNTVKFRVWERGSGETWACGTGASAVCVAAVQIGRAGKKGEPLTVIAKGGTLQVTFDKNDHVYLEGPAVTSFTGVVEVPDEVVK